MSIELVARLREQRRSWVYLKDDVPDKAISFLRPPETEMHKLAAAGGIGLEQVLQYVDGWRGITPEDVLPGCGLTAEQPFDPKLLREWLTDNAALVSRLAVRIAQAVDDHLSKAAAATKN
jgi:hypothetical protein